MIKVSEGFAAPELIRPRLKKYGLVRPDFSLKEPNFRTPWFTARWRNAAL